MEDKIREIVYSALEEHEKKEKEAVKTALKEAMEEWINDLYRQAGKGILNKVLWILAGAGTALVLWSTGHLQIK